MARYKHIDTQPKLLPVDLAAQLHPGTFEHALHHLLSGPVDLTPFDARFHNDETGAPAYPPALLLKVILFAYSRGIVSSRAIAQACQEHVTFIALCGDQAPHFTTIAHFVSTLNEEIGRVFGAVVAICAQQGLIGREMFAIDGVKLPSNAAKQRSGTRADFERQADKLERVAATILERHRATDALPVEPSLAAKAVERAERLTRDAAQLREWLATHPEERRGPKGAVRKSNRTDNESAKMATGKGVIQGYTGVAVVDAAHQIIVEAQAHGTGSEQELLVPVVTAMQSWLTPTSVLTADAGYHSEANLAALAPLPGEALIADADMRRRDERFATQGVHRAAPDPLHDKSAPAPPDDGPGVFTASAFTYDAETRTCVCPAGNTLNRNGQHRVIRDSIWTRFQGKPRDCGACALRDHCIQSPATTKVRTVMFLEGKVAPTESHTYRMKQRIDSPEGRALYGQRFGAVEPVFANVCYNKGLCRFTLRGRPKVDGQWKLFCLVHNIEKLMHAGYAA